MKPIRLDKFLSHLWRSIRSQTPKLVKQWHVLINWSPAKKPDDKVKEWDIIKFFNEEVAVQEHAHILIYKPAWYVSSDVPDWKRPSYLELIPDFPYSNMVHIAGRLDVDSTWLLFATSDGQLIHEITSPRRHRQKVYEVMWEKEITDEQIEQMKLWVVIEDDYQTMPCDIIRLSNNQIQITLYEWKFHQIKQMFEAVQNKVTKLHRTKIWEYEIWDLQVGEWVEVEI